MKCDVCGTEYLRTGGPDPLPLALYKDGGVFLPRTGHQVDKAVLGEGLAYYFARVATQINGDPNQAGAILLMGDTYNIGHTGDPILDLAVHVDAFSNPSAYGLGGAGAPPVAAGPGVPTAPTAGPAGSINNGSLEPNGVNSPWVASAPGQVQYIRATDTGYFSAVCEAPFDVYVGVGFHPGVATYADLLAGGVRGTQTAEVHVRAGDNFCYAHDGNTTLRMRASGR